MNTSHSFSWKQQTYAQIFFRCTQILSFFFKVIMSESVPRYMRDALYFFLVKIISILSHGDIWRCIFYKAKYTQQLVLDSGFSYLCKIIENYNFGCTRLLSRFNSFQYSPKRTTKRKEKAQTKYSEEFYFGYVSELTYVTN